MNVRLVKIASLASMLAATVVLSLLVKAATVESEMSKVTLFVEGMMKSRGGVTWMSWPESVVAALLELPGIQSEATVEMILERDAFNIEYNASLTSLDDMYAAILDLGFTPLSSVENDSDRNLSLNGEEVPQPIANALAVAQTENKPLFVDFFAEWCIACKTLEQQILNSVEVQSALENYVVVKVDTELFPDSGMYYKIVGMPTLIVLDLKGEELFRTVGSISIPELSAELEKLKPQ